MQEIKDLFLIQFLIELKLIKFINNESITLLSSFGFISSIFTILFLGKSLGFFTING